MGVIGSMSDGRTKGDGCRRWYGSFRLGAAIAVRRSAQPRCSGSRLDFELCELRELERAGPPRTAKSALDYSGHIRLDHNDPLWGKFHLLAIRGAISRKRIGVRLLNGKAIQRTRSTIVGVDRLGLLARSLRYCCLPPEAWTAGR